jgi:hypothetical protein
MAEQFVAMSDDLAAFIGANPGSKVSDQHGTFAGASHSYVVVEGGEVKLVVFPSGGAVPDNLKASTWHDPITTAAKNSSLVNDLLSAAVRYSKSIGG